MNIFHKAKIYQTKAVSEKSKENACFSTQILIAIRRFYRQDWGNISDEDKEVNIDALKYKDFLLGSYNTCHGEIWVTAESSDKVEYDIVTVLFPEDY